MDRSGNRRRRRHSRRGQGGPSSCCSGRHSRPVVSTTGWRHHAVAATADHHAAGVALLVLRPRAGGQPAGTGADSAGVSGTALVFVAMDGRPGRVRCPGRQRCWPNKSPTSARTCPPTSSRHRRNGLDDTFGIQNATSTDLRSSSTTTATAALASLLGDVADDLARFGSATVVERDVPSVHRRLCSPSTWWRRGPRYGGWCARSSMPSRHQRMVLEIWDLAIEKTGGYILLPRRAGRDLGPGSTGRLFEVLLGVPSSLALALWVGVISQFIPVVGTYIAGRPPGPHRLLGEPGGPASGCSGGDLPSTSRSRTTCSPQDHRPHHEYPRGRGLRRGHRRVGPDGHRRRAAGPALPATVQAFISTKVQAVADAPQPRARTAPRGGRDAGPERLWAAWRLTPSRPITPHPCPTARALNRAAISSSTASRSWLPRGSATGMRCQGHERTGSSCRPTPPVRRQAQTLGLGS